MNEAKGKGIRCCREGLFQQWLAMEEGVKDVCLSKSQSREHCVVQRDVNKPEDFHLWEAEGVIYLFDGHETADSERGPGDNGEREDSAGSC